MKETLKLLRGWNRSENIGNAGPLVAFVWKIESSREFTDEVLEFCENLIWDREDLVLKGVGWALRDSMNGDRNRVTKYVKSLRRRGESRRG